MKLQLGDSYPIATLEDLGFDIRDFPVGRNNILRSYGDLGARLDRENWIYLGVRVNGDIRLIEYFDLEAGNSRMFPGDK